MKFKESKYSIADFLRYLVEQDLADTWVTRISLFVRSYTILMSKSQESGSWESTFGTNAETIIAVTFRTPLQITTDPTHSCYEIAQGPATKNIRRMYRDISQNVYGMIIEDDRNAGNEFTLLMTYSGANAKIKWDMGRNANMDLPILAAGFETAHTVQGPFSLVHMVNYLDLSRFHIYSAINIQGGGSVSHHSERDFAVQLLLFLDYIEKSRNKKDEYLASAERRLHFKCEMSSNMHILKGEKEKIVVSDASEQKPVIHRIF